MPAISAATPARRPGLEISLKCPCCYAAHRSVQEPKKVLDVGCGIGGTSRYLAAKFKDASVTGGWRALLGFGYWHWACVRGSWTDVWGQSREPAPGRKIKVH